MREAEEDRAWSIATTTFLEEETEDAEEEVKARTDSREAGPIRVKADRTGREIGRASCRERVYVLV